MLQNWIAVMVVQLLLKIIETSEFYEVSLFKKSRKKSSIVLERDRRKLVSNLSTKSPVIRKFSLIDCIIFRKQNPISLGEETKQKSQYIKCR